MMSTLAVLVGLVDGHTMYTAGGFVGIIATGAIDAVRQIKEKS
jgi:hypothetical protein